MGVVHQKTQNRANQPARFLSIGLSSQTLHKKNQYRNESRVFHISIQIFADKHFQIRDCETDSLVTPRGPVMKMSRPGVIILTPGRFVLAARQVF